MNLQIAETTKLSRLLIWFICFLFFICLYILLFKHETSSLLYIGNSERIIQFFEKNKTNPTNYENISTADDIIQVFTPAAYVSDEEEIETVAKRYPNIPLRFWFKVKNSQKKMFLKNSSCARFPDMFSLNLNNVYWQMVHMSNQTSVQLYSAYYDTREISGRMVRILSMVNRTKQNFPGNRTFYCQLWFDEEVEPVIAPMDSVDYMWLQEWNSHGDGSFGPYLLGCSIPESHSNKTPQVVSFVENPCDNASNMLRVVYDDVERKGDISVCVKGLDFLQVDLSYRLVEWIELVFLLGADKIYFYEFEVHHKMRRVLDYYQKLGKIDLRPIKLPSGHPSIPFLEHIFMLQNNVAQCLDEIIPYNDCFYRNLYSHDYVALLDIDEMILPVKDGTWQELIRRGMASSEPNTRFNAFTSQHVYFLDRMDPESPHQGIPPYMHMMQHVYRSSNFTPWDFFIKTIFNTKETISCHNHWPISVAPGTQTHSFPYDEARMHHYRKDCSWEVKCEDYEKELVKDTRIWEYRDLLIPRVNRVLREVGLLKSNKHHN